MKKYFIESFFWVLLLFVPLSLIFEFVLDNPILAFICATLALVPLARIIGHATNQLVLQTNPNIGGLLNATLGNAIELLIAIFALSKGLIDVVQASIVGSIIGNALLLTGISIFAGGLKFHEQKFNKAAIGISSTMLIIAVTGLAIPTAFVILTGKVSDAILLSDAVAIVLAIVYISGLIFSLKTHKHLFDITAELKSIKEKASWSIRKSVLVLLVTTIIVAIESELLVSHIEVISNTLGWSQMFIGVVVIAIVTNIAEKANAIHFARQNKIDIALEIGLSSAIQIALFVVPILMLLSAVFLFKFTLVFSLFEIISMIFAVMIINYLSADGVTNWLEGVQLLAVYLIIIAAFYFI